MRAALDALYKGSGLLAGFFLIAIASLTLLQIGGRQLGFAARSFDEFAGYCMAASSFLGLAWTLRENEHIRMTLVLHLTHGAARRALEIACLCATAFLVGFFAWYACDMVLTSFRLNDVSQGLVAVPLWIPQAGMALGLVLLFIALADDLVAVLLRRTTSYAAAETRKSGATSAFER